MANDEIRVIEINYRQLFQILRHEKWWILGVTLLMLAVGIVYSLLMREEFESRGKVLPEVQTTTGSLSGLSGLAGLAGLNINGPGAVGGDAISPRLYPDVINSIPFYLALFDTQVYTHENKQLTFEEFYHQVVRQGKDPDEQALFKYPVELDGIIVLSRLDEMRINDLRERVVAEIDNKTGVISIQTTMPDPVVAAQVTRFAMNYLMEYIVDYRTEKLQKDVAYLEQQIDSVRARYFNAQEERARYADQFRTGTIRMQSADLQRERLESEYRLSSSVYNELSSKYEEVTFKLSQEKPVFQVLEPPVPPNEKSSPRRKRIASIWLVIGGITSFIFVILKNGNYKKVFVI